MIDYLATPAGLLAPNGWVLHLVACRCETPIFQSISSRIDELRGGGGGGVGGAGPKYQVPAIQKGAQRRLCATAMRTKPPVRRQHGGSLMKHVWASHAYS